jgi:hypothetical protein
VNVGLPGVPGHPVALHVVIDETNGGVSASAAPTRDVDDGVEALVAYLAGGWIREAVEIALGPVRRRGVVGATLSNLTLLRAGHHDAVDSRFEPSPDLPDSFVVAAEAAVRRGDSGGAVGWLTEALGRGLPVFGDALAILARRVDRHDTGIPEEWIDRTLAASERADLSTVMTTFAAAEPLDAAHSERPAEDFVGWIEYRGALEGGQLMPA